MSRISRLIYGGYRRLKLRLLMFNEFEGITPLNTVEEFEGASKDTEAFHWLIKKPLRYIIRSIVVPQRWLDRLDGNPRELYKIVQGTYFPNEKQGWRHDTLKPVFEYGLCLYAFDNNYREIFDSMLAKLIQARGVFKFDHHQINPDNWFQDGRGRIEVDKSTPFSVLSLSDSTIVLDRIITTQIITTYGSDGANVQYLALDLDGRTEPYSDIHVYPILSRGTSVLDVAPVLLRQTEVTA